MAQNSYKNQILQYLEDQRHSYTQGCYTDDEHNCKLKLLKQNHLWTVPISVCKT